LGALDTDKASSNKAEALTSVSLFDQGLAQVLQAAVTGLEPKQPYVLSLPPTLTVAARWSRWRTSLQIPQAQRSLTPPVRSGR
jgi:hypothetical protein